MLLISKVIISQVYFQQKNKKFFHNIKINFLYFSKNNAKFLQNKKFIYQNSML